MSTYTESLGHNTLPFSALLCSQTPSLEALNDLFNEANTPERCPSAHLAEEILRDNEGRVMDQIVIWLETNMIMLIYFAVGEMQNGRDPRPCLQMAHSCWGMLITRGEELLKGADPTFPLPQFAKAVADTEPETSEPFHEPTETPEILDNTAQE